MNDIAISLKNVSKYYKLYKSPQDRLKEALNFSGKQYHQKFYATKNVDLEIRKGEILGIVGKNGSGKSTLLKLITGVLQPDEGEISVNGKISALLELGSGFNPEFTGMENIFFYGTILGFTKEEMKEKVDDIVAFAEIGDFIHQPLKTYSSGMKSRLGFAVAVHIDPEILILDEVLSVGDELFRRKSYAKMEEFFRAGKTILYVSHNANSINELCTRAIFLNEGSILLNSNAKTVTTFYQKYLFAKKDNVKKIIQEIKESAKLKTYSNEKNVTIGEKPKTAFYIPDFKPSNMVIIKNFDAEISNPNLYDENDSKVNALLLKHRYRYSFDVEFNTDATNVSFSAQIKSEKGMRISQKSLSRDNNYISNVKKGDKFRINWFFTCYLLPGTYFIDCSTTGYIQSDEELMSQKKDIYCFKVIGTKRGASVGGIVTLDQVIKYEYII